MTDRRDDDDFADAAEELSTVLRDLRDELERESPRGPFGLPRPPSPGEVLRFADEVAIPGTIAILEVNVRLLETVQRAIRLVDSSRRTRDRASSQAEDSMGRLRDVSDQTLARLESSLSDLQGALDGDGMPENEAARDLLDEANRLREDVQSRLRDARSRDHTLDEFDEPGTRADGASAGERADRKRDDSVAAADAAAERDEFSRDDAVRSGGGQVDVDAELETLKERYGNDDERSDSGSSGSPDGSDGTQGDDDSDENDDTEGDDESDGSNDTEGDEDSGGSDGAEDEPGDGR